MKKDAIHAFIIKACKKFLPLPVRNFLNYFRSRMNFLIFRIRKNGFVKTYKGLLPIYFYNIASIFFSIPIALFIFLLTPIIKIRLIRLLSERLGHFCLNTEIMLCAFDEGVLNKRHNSKKISYFFYTHRIVSNKQLLKMWKRLLPVLSLPIACCQVDKMLSFFSAQYRNDTLKKTVEDGNWADDRMRLMERIPRAHVFFTWTEEKRGITLMEKLGLPSDARYVCLGVRDSLYLEKLFPGNNWCY